MTTATLNLPDFTTQDAATYKAYIDAMAKVYQRIAGNFAAHEQNVGSPAPEMSVRVDAGYIFSGTTLTEVAAQTVGGFTTPSAGQERYDRVVIDATTGVASRIAGTASTGSPSSGLPAISNGKIPCCYVHFTSADTVITNNMITDERVTASSGSAGGHGECQLTLSGGNLLLSPKNGNRLRIAGTVCTIAAAGITVSNASLGSPNPVNATYYVYASATAGVVDTLTLSTTGHSADSAASNLGVEIMTGNNTYTLVGMARVNASGNFADGGSQRFVLSWFNRQQVPSAAAFTADRSTASTTFVELNTEIRTEFLVWGSDVALTQASGGVRQGTVSVTQIFTSIAYDGITAEDTMAEQEIGSNAGSSIGLSLPKKGLTEGYHYATLIGKTSSGTFPWCGSATPGLRCVLTTTVQG